jgi:hypothetical protein
MQPNPLLTLRVVWFAILSATVAFLFIPMPVSDPASGATLLLPLALTAAGCAAGSLLLPLHVLRSGLRRLKLQTIDVDNREPALETFAAQRRVFRDPDIAAHAAFGVYRTATILGLALAEAVALDGFVLKFLAVGVANFMPFFIVSWALILALFPRRAVIARALERAYGIGPIA